MGTLRTHRVKQSLVHSLSSRKKRLLATCLAAGLGAGISSVANADTSSVLLGLGMTNSDVPVNHGSNAEVTLQWDTTWDQYAAWNGRGDVYQVDENTAFIVFTPAGATVRVAVSSFDLDEWAGGGDTSALWSVTGSSSGLLASGNWTRFNTANDPQDRGGRETINVGALGAAGETLTLLFDHTNTGSISYLAMDNLAFSTAVVPEPATAAWLGVTGLGALAMRRRKK
jgi:hypothetical protein